MTRKSKYDLEHFAPLKIPKNMFESLKEMFGDRWSEKARDILADFLIKPEMTDAYVEPEM